MPTKVLRKGKYLMNDGNDLMVQGWFLTGVCQHM
jgi:hypothetical protein